MNLLRNLFKDKKNYYSLFLALLIGIILILNTNLFQSSNNFSISQKSDAYSNSSNTESQLSYEENIEKKLENILSSVDGVGNVKVMITFENSKEIVTKDDSFYENSITSEESTTGDSREILTESIQSTTVKINQDEPLILTEINPKVSGVIIVAEGGGNIEVKNNLINATKALLNVEIHKIEVLKMK